MRLNVRIAALHPSKEYARALLRDVIPTLTQTQDSQLTVSALEATCHVLLYDNPEAAAQLHGATTALRHAHHMQPTIDERHLDTLLVQHLVEILGTTATRRAEHAGATPSRDESIVLAQSLLSPRPLQKL